MPAKFEPIEEVDTMKVSKLLIWCLAVLATLSFAFMPAMADNPWSDENENGSNEGDAPGNGSVTPDDPDQTDPDNPDVLYGSSLWWLGLIWDGLSDEDNVTNAASAASVPAEDSETETNQPGGLVR
jgi:hypothetical protein